MATVSRSVRRSTSSGKSCYYVLMKLSGVDGIVPVDAFVTKQDARDRRLSPGDKITLRRELFVPLQSPRRFRIAETEWDPSAVYRMPMPIYKDQSKEEREANFQRFFAARDEYSPPDGLLAVPTQNKGMNEFYDTPGELLTREQVFKRAADENRETVTEKGGLDNCVGERWRFVVELGETVCCGLSTIHFDENGMGVEHQEVIRPIRLVRPTEAEIKQYALPSRKKGGAA